MGAASSRVAVAGWLSLAVLYRVISRFLAQLFFTEVSPIQPDEPSIPLFKGNSKTVATSVTQLMPTLLEKKSPQK